MARRRFRIPVDAPYQHGTRYLGPVRRWVLPVDHDFSTAWKHARSLAERACEDHDLVRHILILTAAPALLAEDMADIVGEARALHLRTGGRIELANGVLLAATSLARLDEDVDPCIVIVHRATMGLLDAIEGKDRIAGVIALPDHRSDITAWMDRWHLIARGDGPDDRPPPLIDDPVVERALRTLNIIVNRETGLSHPRDLEYASKILRILHMKNHHLQPERIHSWALSKGWLPLAAGKLAAMAERIAWQDEPASGSYIPDASLWYGRWI